jgi:urease accessory protein
MAMATITATITEPGLFRLMAWLSPGFPVGGYTYSHGLEFAVEADLVSDAPTLTDWVASVITHGAGRLDGQLFAIAWQAVTDGDDNRLAWAVERADAMRGTSEMALESVAQGEAFFKTVREAWPDPRLERWADELAVLDRRPPYAVAVAVAAGAYGIPLRPALTAYLHAFAANLVSAGLRLLPIGQTAGQRALAKLAAIVEAAVEAAIVRDVEDLGAATAVVDWASMRHETQYTRLFRS